VTFHHGARSISIIRFPLSFFYLSLSTPGHPPEHPKDPENNAIVSHLRRFGTGPSMKPGSLVVASTTATRVHWLPHPAEHHSAAPRPSAVLPYHHVVDTLIKSPATLEKLLPAPTPEPKSKKATTAKPALTSMPLAMLLPTPAPDATTASTTSDVGRPHTSYLPPAARLAFVAPPAERPTTSSHTTGLSSGPHVVGYVAPKVTSQISPNVRLQNQRSLSMLNALSHQGANHSVWMVVYCR
jgi:hypothetical protein